MKTKTVYALIGGCVVLFLIAFLFASASCDKEIDFTPASRVDLGIIEAGKGETYRYAGKDYGTHASAVSACIATRMDF